MALVIVGSSLTFIGPESFPYSSLKIGQGKIKGTALYLLLLRPLYWEQFP